MLHQPSGKKLSHVNASKYVRCILNWMILYHGSEETVKTNLEDFGINSKGRGRLGYVQTAWPRKGRDPLVR